MEHEPKISTAEAFLIVSYVGLCDIIGIILVCFALDDFFILDILTFPVTQLYFRFKKVRAYYDMWAGLAELVPYLGALPIKTIGVLAVIWADRNPEGRLVQAAKIASTINIRSPKQSPIPMAQFAKGERGIPMAQIRKGGQEGIPMARFRNDSKNIPMAQFPQGEEGIPMAKMGTEEIAEQ